MTSGLAACALIRHGGVIGRAERGERGADFGAAEFLQACFEALLQRVAEGVVGRDEVPLLAEFIEQQLGDRVGLHARRVADAEDVPMAVRAGNGVGVAAGDDVQDLPGSRPRQGPAPCGVDVAEQEIDLVAVDQLVRLLHGGAGVGAGRVFESSSAWRPRMPPLALICSIASLAPISSFLPSSA